LYLRSQETSESFLAHLFLVLRLSTSAKQIIPIVG
jgi:hypothetical protein